MFVCVGRSAVTLILLLCVCVKLQRGRRCGGDGDGQAAGWEVRTGRGDGGVQDGGAAERQTIRLKPDAERRVSSADLNRCRVFAGWRRFAPAPQQTSSLITSSSFCLRLSASASCCCYVSVHLKPGRVACCPAVGGGRWRWCSMGDGSCWSSRCRRSHVQVASGVTLTSFS